MIKPHNLFPLPQDKYVRPNKPKSSPQQFKQFLNKIKTMGVKI